ncbi:MAG: flagellar hook-basal body complex protein FliE [Bacteroidota bacterium]|nr:flagellar hook-basal body complex protein FliE [Bacteroidota bacterium]MDP4192276.1 flagellar hook-basal body complex protein FliE [Bacteroidota bacterium]MDP4195394.1 flagellar hook-basal body complex protein FliE [Bacteroidota bacterium]
MQIGSIQNIFKEIPRLKEVDKKDDSQFGEVLGSLIDQVNQDQNTANKMVKDFAEGKEVELHEVMIAGEKAKTSLELLMEIRNKTIDMYKELTRIQI